VGEVECLVLERAAFMKLLMPSADRTFEEEMLNREAKSSGLGAGGASAKTKVRRRL
jgi:hypothetical protein